MTQIRMAFPASILLLTLTVPVTGQTPDESDGSSFVTRGSIQTPSQVATTPSTPVQTQLGDEEMGDLYMARKEYRDAADVYKRLVDAHPKNAVYMNKLGIAMHQQVALGAALKYYERAVKLDPQYADAQNNIGTIWYQRKRFGKSIKAYQKAIKLRDTMPILYSNLGYAYFGDKRYEESIVAFRHALTLDPLVFEHNSSRTGSLLQDRSVGDRGRFYFLLAKSFAEAGNAERCLLYLRKAKDEGYTGIADVKTDPAFSAVLQLPAVQEVLMPRVDTTQP